MEIVFLYPIKNELTGFGQVMALGMMNHLFRAYTVINEIDLKENDVRMMGP